MSVPVVSLAGQTAPGREGLSILTTAGMPKVVAGFAERFVKIAAAAHHADRHAIRQKLSASALMDAPRFARNVETAYRGMSKHSYHPHSKMPLGGSLRRNDLRNAMVCAAAVVAAFLAVNPFVQMPFNDDWT